MGKKKSKGSRSEEGGKKQKKEKKNERKGGSGGGVVSITVSGEIFFTEPNLTVHRISKRDRDILDGYALLSIKNLMTRSQKSEMNPLVINIKKVTNLPVEKLSQNGYTCKILFSLLT